MVSTAAGCRGAHCRFRSRLPQSGAETILAQRSMPRRTLAIVALALLAWLFVRARPPDGSTPAPPVAPDSLAHPAPGLESEPAAVEAPQSPPGRSHPDGALFEPLPEDPSGILVHLRDAATHAPVLGAEVFVCEEQRWDWSSLAYDSDAPWPDVEAELRARGRRIESDTQGNLQLPIPSAWLAVMARKDERFGALTLGFENAPEAQLDLYASSPCSVRIRDAAGRPVAGEQLVLATQNGNAFWRGASDATGTARVPNLGWRIADGSGDSETWFAMANDACAAAPIRWFARAEPAPSAFELVVGDAQRVRLHVVASDGTRVPIDGHVGVSPRSTSGSTSVLRLPRRTNPQLPLARGEALIARGEPGGWLDLEVGLAGSVSFEAALRVPARGEAAGELTLRMPAELQVLLLHPTDEQGTPLARQEFEWVSWGQREGDDRQLDQHIDRVRSDETGLLALAIARLDLHPQQAEEPAGPRRAFVHSGALRLHGARELESATFPFAALGADAVHDHGALALASAMPLVRGRVVDDRGQPLAQVRIGLEQLHVWDGDHELESLAGVETKSGARTGADGRFVLYGKCLGGRLQLNLTREGYLAPRGSEQELFECGSSPDLQLVLLRPAELETSVRVPARLDRRLVWLIDDGSPDLRMEEIEPPAGGGLLVHDHAGFLPGTYRVSLRELDDSTAAAILEVENVLLRPGERTLDPRLLDVDLMRFALAGNAPPPELPGAADRARDPRPRWPAALRRAAGRALRRLQLGAGVARRARAHRAEHAARLADHLESGPAGLDRRVSRAIGRAAAAAGADAQAAGAHPARAAPRGLALPRRAARGELRPAPVGPRHAARARGCGRRWIRRLRDPGRVHARAEPGRVRARSKRHELPRGQRSLQRDLSHAGGPGRRRAAPDRAHARGMGGGGEGARREVTAAAARPSGRVMRGTILLGALLVLGTALWFVQRPVERIGCERVSQLEPIQTESRRDLEFEADGLSAHAARTPGSTEGALRFEDLEPEPTELVVRLVTGENEAPVLDAEIFALEPGYEVFDVETEARARGRRLECDANGRVYLGLPRAELFVCARKGELFGGAWFSASDAPDASLSLMITHTSRVRVLSTAGEALAGIPIVMGNSRGSSGNATTGTAGELLLPNVEWLIEHRLYANPSWFVGVDAPFEEPPLRWFDSGAAAPLWIDLTLPAASALRLRVLASDGTPVPVSGEVSLYLLNGGDHRAAARLKRGETTAVPLIAGEALVPCAEPGAWLDADVDLDGDTAIHQNLRVPETGAAIELRLPKNLQALLFCACDERGVALASRKLEWISYSQEEGDIEQQDTSHDCVRTDELGRCALVVDRRDLQPPEIDPDEDPPKPKHWRGILRLREGATQLESGPIDFGDLGAGSVRNLGRVQLAVAQPLVRGHVRDADGKPLARSSIGLVQLTSLDGKEYHINLLGVDDVESEEDGSFAIFGTCPGGRLRLTIDRTDYDLPGEASMPEFDCGASPDLEVVLARTGTLCTSVLADAALSQWYRWELEDANGEQHEHLSADNGPGEIPREFRSLRPGRVRVRLVRSDTPQPPIVEFDDVIIQSGRCTFDPRLLRVPIHVPPGSAAVLVRTPEPPPIPLHIVDEQGGRIETGLLITFTHCGSHQTEFRGGRVDLRACQESSTIGLWAPGHMYWEGPCPEREREMVLEPALRVRLHVDEPEELRRAGIRLLMDSGFPKVCLQNLAGSAELDPQGDVQIECPLPCRMWIGLRGMVLDKSGALRGAQVELETEEDLFVDVTDEPLEQRFELKIRAEEWAALARALGVGR